MNVPTLIVGAAVVLVLAAVVFSIRRGKKQGRSACCGKCAGCGMNCACHTPK